MHLKKLIGSIHLVKAERPLCTHHNDQSKPYGRELVGFSNASLDDCLLFE